MFTHEQIWRGIDRLAAHAQTSPSGLARRAGLDSTTFNPSKRASRDGSKPRWPSTESLAKALSAAHMDLAGFVGLMTGVPVMTGVQARSLSEDSPAAFDAGGRPSGESWTRIAFPGPGAESAYALTVEDDSMRPVYRRGDRLIVAPDSPLRPGDRVLVKHRETGLEAFELGEHGVKQVVLQPIRADRPTQKIALSEIDWIARILWASQ
ncbi:MAG: helix-turn-helix transcriptional regulator [Alphaproteobacteria bacterium]|jgi:phage repressor protein C with HTH and peptisase S24 domain|uniref:S24 family peptidase n=1 Tax=Maricaulis alexandrii TaxID=2570354 RepID=UPI00110896F1|nr:helix-turn-helix transcriptional regulator [Maricaulis alexandrii]MCR9267293.1 helix-turn-helix transcriptional regulator [Alphaproteobacteria bacterium]